MQKPRMPGTIADAVAKIIGGIGRHAAADAVEKSPAHVYRWADPDSDHQPNIDQAMALDAAFVNATGDEPPILMAMKARLDAMTAAARAARRDPMMQVARVTKEMGDVAQAVAQAVADGRVSSREAMEVGQQIADLEREAQRLRKVFENDDIITNKKGG